MIIFEQDYAVHHERGIYLEVTLSSENADLVLGIVLGKRKELKNAAHIQGSPVLVSETANTVVDVRVLGEVREATNHKLAVNPHHTDFRPNSRYRFFPYDRTSRPCGLEYMLLIRE